MVLLTMTVASVAAVQECAKLGLRDVVESKSPTEPSLENPQVGKPISRGQLVGIFRSLERHYQSTNGVGIEVHYHLEELLRGSKIYIPPAPPKKEPVSYETCLLQRWY